MRSPSKRQVAITRGVVEWYLSTHHGGPHDVGMIGTFCRVETVGSVAVDRESLECGSDEALFRLFVTVAMFQRLRDETVMHILRSLSPPDAFELTSLASLHKLSSGCLCPNARTNQGIIANCNLTKDQRGQGTCNYAPQMSCYLKRHTQLLRRYGHFGKMPTSAALTVLDHGGSMRELRRRVFDAVVDPRARAIALECALSEVWRVGNKLANMYLSLVAAPNMGLRRPPWGEGLDWTWFVVVDRNVDLFLASIGYSNGGTYEARSAFVRALAEHINLRDLDANLPSVHPRLVQQAMYLFMSSSNRAKAPDDCSVLGADACSVCPTIRAIS